MNIYPEFLAQYHQYIKYGIDYLKDKNICITGLIKNGANHIASKTILFEEIKKYTNKLDVVVYENDSTDNTVDILRSWSSAKNYELHLITEKLNSTHRGHPYKDIERTNAMASYRNKCLAYIKDHIDTDYVMVIDLDYIQISVDGILNSYGWIGHKPSINIMAGFSYQQHDNGLLTNYDSWAYRGNWWNDYQNDKNFAYTFINWRPFIGATPFKINSAFGGSCIYKYDTYVSGTYCGKDCEHVTFHRSIYNIDPDKYCAYVNPSQIMIV